MIRIRFCSSFAIPLLLISLTAYAHDPIFSPGPHVIYQGGVEIETGFFTQKVGSEEEYEPELGLQYGITGDWIIGAETPYYFKSEDGTKADGLGDTVLSTKYRFWRKDTLGAQDALAVLLQVKLGTADNNTDPMLGTGTTDVMTGLTYGYEGRRWYRWASVRYRYNGTRSGFHPGNTWLLDVAGGIRPRLTPYRAWDTVLILELNTELMEQSTLDDVTQPDTGGQNMFLSPGVMMTKRNFEMKAGVQIPVYYHLDGDQPATDYRAIIIFEWHL